MKNLFTLLTLITLTFVTNDVISQDFIKLFETKNYEELINHFDYEVNVEFNRDKQSLTKEEAINHVKKKLEAFNPTKWESMHKGKADNKADNYLITKIYNKKDEGLRLFIHIEEINGQKKICSLRFRKAL